MEPTDIDLGQIGDAKVADVVAWAGDDSERRAAALAAEQARGDDARPTLLKQLQPDRGETVLVTLADVPNNPALASVDDQTLQKGSTEPTELTPDQAARLRATGVELTETNNA